MSSETKETLIRPVFVGELTMDVLIYTDDPIGRPDSGEAGAASRRFERLALVPDEWAKYVQQAVSSHRFEVAVGGSIANAAAAFAASLRRHKAEFLAVEGPYPTKAHRPLWWRGFSLAASDLAARQIRVHSPDVAPMTPETLGAVVYIDQAGRTLGIVANAQRCWRPSPPPGTALIVRTDHLRLLDEAYASDFRVAAFLLADDGSGWEDAAQSVSSLDRAWIFGTSAQIGDLVLAFPALSHPRVALIATNGPEACTIRVGDETHRLAVPLAHEIKSDLGAGDAYMGGYLSGALHDAAVGYCHVRGCERAGDALSTSGARIRRSMDLNLKIPAIGRRSPRDDEGELYLTVRTSPGVAVVTGGQTGVDSIAAKSALASGLPVHLVFPRGFRQEDGPATHLRTQRLEGSRFHELGSDSFRYRTWASVFVSDAVILVDRAGGEGSEETRRAAKYFRKPVLEPDGVETLTAEVASWLANARARVVLVAGSRRSLIAARGTGRGLKRELDTVMAGICQRNAELLAGRDGVCHGEDLFDRVGIAKPVSAWVNRTRAVNVAASARIVVLSPRDVATALGRGELDFGITWPSLVPSAVLAGCSVRPLGAFPVHYGFLCDASSITQRPRLAIQYEDAFTRWSGDFLGDDVERFGIEGSAEAWIGGGLAEMAYDSYRTGRTTSALGLSEFFPTHWETVAVLWANARGTDGS